MVESLDLSEITKVYDEGELRGGWVSSGVDGESVGLSLLHWDDLKSRSKIPIMEAHNVATISSAPVTTYIGISDGADYLGQAAN